MKLDVDKFMDLADSVRNDVVFCLLGAPGIGKTRQIQQWADKHGRKMVEIIASQILPNEVSGITMPVTETKGMEIFDHVRLSNLKDGDILFFDELLAAAPSTLSACLTLIEDRRMMSGTKLPDVIIIAAANPVGNCRQIPLAVRQRFQFIDMDWDYRSWLQYMTKTFEVDCTRLVKYIGDADDDGSSYNLLTPRSATKMVRMFQADQSDMTQRLIRSMYGQEVLEAIVDAFNLKEADRVAKTFGDEKLMEIILEASLNLHAEYLAGVHGDMADYEMAALARYVHKLNVMSNIYDIMKSLNDNKRIDDIAVVCDYKKKLLERLENTSV